MVPTQAGVESCNIEACAKKPDVRFPACDSASNRLLPCSAAVALAVLVCAACAGKAPPSPALEPGGDAAATQTAVAALQSDAAATIAAGRATIEAAAAAATVVAARETLAAAELTAAAPTRPPLTSTLAPSATRLPTESPTPAIPPEAATPGAFTGPVEAQITYVNRGDIWIMNVDGGGKRALMTGVHAEGATDWSPDGRRIAFTKNANPGGSHVSHIVIADADGSDAVELKFGEFEDWPSWTPDGSRLAFVMQPEGIFSVRPDGSDRRFLTQGLCPAWSPDSARLAYAKMIEGKPGVSGIYVADADGSDPVRLTEGVPCGANICGDLDPSWSPHGDKIAYGCGDAICTMDAGGSNRRVLAKPGDDPRWSPDGTHILFDRLSANGIYLMNADGSNLRKIADGGWPAWRLVQAGGSSAGAMVVAPTTAPETPAQLDCHARIAYVQEWGQIWTMKPDGSDKKLLSAPGVDVWHPKWFPDGKRLVFTTHQETYFVNSDGQGLTKQPYDYEYPAISPDGQRLAGKFSQMKPWEGGGQAFVTDNLVVLGLDGKHLTKLTKCDEGEPCVITNPAWSPDALWIATGLTQASKPGVDLWLIRSDGSERRKILSLAGIIMPSWSPDGQRIAFLTREPVIDGKATIWILNTDGSGLHQLPLKGLDLQDAVPSWSPDGKKLAFVAGSGVQKNRKVYTVSVDGGQPVALGSGWDPAWQPCPWTDSK